MPSSTTRTTPPAGMPGATGRPPAPSPRSGGPLQVIELVEAGGEQWGSLREVFAGRGGPSRCHCQWFHQPGPQWRASRPPQRQEALRASVERSSRDPQDGRPAPGVVALVDGEPAGWTAVGPRAGYRRLTWGSRLRAAGVADDLEDAGVWSLTCFVVRPAYRGGGLTTRLLTAAVALAGRHGAHTVEAYPIDMNLSARRAAADLYPGVLSTFLAAGFSEVGRTADTRAVVRLQLPAPG